MFLRLFPYTFKVVYQPGSENQADFLSHHPIRNPAKADEHRSWIDGQVQHAYVAALCQYAISKQQIKDATTEDNFLQNVMTAVASQKWSDLDDSLTPFKRVREELSVADGLLLRGNRKVVPARLQKEMIKIAHKSHQGIVKTKALLRETVWFPGIDWMVEEAIANCLPCQATTTKPGTQEPVRSTMLPDGPWKEVSTDFCGPFKSGEHLLVVIDGYSRFPEVEIVTSTSARSVIPRLDSIFVRQGIPEILKTDNGPPFNGSDFASWAHMVGFKHKKITPLWPQANGEAERFMRTLGKVVKTAMTETGNNNCFSSSAITGQHHTLRQVKARVCCLIKGC